MRISDPQVAERNRLIVAHRRANPEQGYEAMAKKYCVSLSTLQRVLHASGLISKTTARRRQTMYSRQSPDKLLRWLGTQLDRKCQEKGGMSTDNKTNRARKIGLRSGQHLQKIFLGQVDIAYSEQLCIASFMGYPSVGEMLLHLSQTMHEAYYDKAP